MAIKREANLMPDARRRRNSDEYNNNDDQADATLAALDQAAGFFARAQVATSILFRFFVYVFLHWIPNRGLYKIIPPLFVIYLLAWLVRQSSVNRAVKRLLVKAQSAQANANLNELTENIDADVTTEEDSDFALSKSANGSSSGVVEGDHAIEHQAEQNGESHSHKEQQTQIRSLSVWEWIKVIVLGRSTRSSKVNLLSLAFHSLLFLFFVDSAWTPVLFPSHYEHTLHFAHVGSIGPKSATIHVRYPFPLGHREDYIGALIEQDLEYGSTGGALKDMQTLLDNPQPIRIVYREVQSMPADDMAVSGGGSIDGRIRTLTKRWERGPLLTLTEESDWTATAKLDSLWPATEYEWRLAFAHNSTFTPMPLQPRRFITWPDPRLNEDKGTLGILRPPATDSRSAAVVPYDDPNHFTFASSSCVKPDFPWQPTQFWAWSWALRLMGFGDAQNGGYAVRNRITGFDKLADATIDGRERPSLRFFLQLGDLIYADSPFYSGPFTHTYRVLYRNLFASESFRRVYERLPIFGIYDDHEVINNWGGKMLQKSVSSEDEEEIRQAHESDEKSELVAEPVEMRPAFKAWQEYVGRANPDALEPGENYYTFRYGDTAFFVMDTRKHRSPFQMADDEHKTMLGEVQRDTLLRWLGAVNSTATFKFVVSSVPFNTLWGGPLDFDGKTDSWAAYTYEREMLLNVMQYVPNVIVLSGDRHEFAAVGLAEQSTREAYHPIVEFSTSPLNMFYLPVRTLSQAHGLGITGAERLYKYIPDGNVKWTEFEVDTRDAVQPVVRVKIVVDGTPAWQVTVHGTQVHKPRHAVGGLALTFLQLLNWRPRRWF